jgi:hypothetical protein
MPSVAEILKASGLSDEAISAIDSKAVSAFNQVLSSAEQARQQAAADAERMEIARRANYAFYDESIAPALNNWASEKAAADAQVAFYRSQLESAKASGFVPIEAPGNEQPRDFGGRYVANAPGSTPGSPTFTADIQRQLATGISNATWALQTHQKLTGEVLPDPVDQLATEADARRLPFRDWVAQKYDYAGKQAEQQRKAQEEHDAKIRRLALEENDRKWAERTGSNPDVRRMEASRFSDVARAVKANERPDPLSFASAQQRRQATAQAIRKDISEMEPPAA